MPRLKPELMKAIGFVQLGRSYAASADHLAAAVAAGNLCLPHELPVDYMYAHAVELLLKGCLLATNPNEAVDRFRHDLMSLYAEVGTRNVSGDILASAEHAVRDRWKRHLRSARDTIIEKFNLEDLSDAALAEFGLYDNATIGAELPELRTHVAYLGMRHSKGGGQLRYLHVGLDVRPRIEAFDLFEDVVWRTVGWGCEAMEAGFHRHCQERA